MGIVNAGMLEVYEEIEPELKVLVEDVLLNRRPDATERLVDFGETLKAAARRRRQREEGRRVAQRHRRGAALARAGEGHRRLHRDRHRGSARQARPPAARHRRPADGRHGRGRRSLRRGQDVPAAGGQIRPRDEEGRRPPHALHGGREGRAWWPPARVVKAQGKIVLATVKGDVHDIGKNIVGVVLACNNYDVIDLGVMVSCEKILERAKAEKADIIGLSGLITPSLDEMVHVATRDGAPGLQAAAAHRRRHHQPRAHRRQDRAALQRARRPRARRQPRRSGHHQPAERRRQGQSSSCSIAPSTRRCASPRRAAPAGRLASKSRASAARPSSGAPKTCPRPHSPASACSTTFRWPRCASTSTGRRSSTPGG